MTEQPVGSISTAVGSISTAVGSTWTCRRAAESPSLAEEALATLHGMRIEPCVVDGVNLNAELQAKYNTIRRALERLQELEGANG